MCVRFLYRLAGKRRSARPGHFADAPAVARVIFRRYHQHRYDECTSHSLALFDRLCLKGIGDVGDQFDQFER